MIGVRPARFATHPRLAALLLTFMAACFGVLHARATFPYADNVQDTAAGTGRATVHGAVAADGDRAAVAEPVGAAAFVAAYARADEAAAERLASPLYVIEWGRRGSSFELRESYVQPAASSAGGWLRFTYQVGMIDRGGFAHLLYTAEPVSGPPVPTVWRIDTAPDGRVIWSEPVWIFARPVSLVHVSAFPSIEDLADIAGTAEPSAHFAPARVAGFRAADATEGYYLAGVEAGASPGASPTRPASVRFFAVDDGGRVRPGAWSYGEPHPGLVEYGRQAEPPVVLLPAEERALRDAYLAHL